VVHEIIPGKLDIQNDDYYLHKDRNTLNVAWYNEKGISFNGVILAVSLTATENGQLADFLRITETRTPNFSYFRKDEVSRLALNFIESKDVDALKQGIVLHQNQPNPFSGSTTIQFEIPRPGEVTFTFWNVAGEQLYEKTGVFGHGMNQLSIMQGELRDYRGLVYYQMEFEGVKTSRTMVAGFK
jgi:hypothetical protein